MASLRRVDQPVVAAAHAEHAHVFDQRRRIQPRGGPLGGRPQSRITGRRERPDAFAMPIVDYVLDIEHPAVSRRSDRANGNDVTSLAAAMRYVYVLVLAVLDQRMGNSTHHVTGRYPTSPANDRNGMAVVDLL